MVFIYVLMAWTMFILTSFRIGFSWAIVPKPLPIPFHSINNYRFLWHIIMSIQQKERKKEKRNSKAKNVGKKTILIWRKNLFNAEQYRDGKATTPHHCIKCEILENFNGWNQYTITDMNRADWHVGGRMELFVWKWGMRNSNTSILQLSPISNLRVWVLGCVYVCACAAKTFIIDSINRVKIK